MHWVVGIDEAGYGPNLGPMVQAAVAVQTPDDGCLWQKLKSTVRRAAEPDDGRLCLDDSKLVYAGKDLARLEIGALAATGVDPINYLADPMLAAEPWHDPTDGSLMRTAPAELTAARRAFGRALCPAKLKIRTAGVVVTPTRPFNDVVDRTGTKGAVTAAGVIRLFQETIQSVPRGPVRFYVDKLGGRHYYAAFLQTAFPDAWPFVVAETPERSEYRLSLRGRQVSVVFAPKSDGEHLCVAVASMLAKYLRERCMAQFNRFWQGHVPDLAPTAGYPNDAKRYLDAIRPAMERLNIPVNSVWRRK